MDTTLLIPAIEQHYRDAVEYIDIMASSGYETLARSYLEALGTLSGRPLRLLMIDVAQGLAFPHGINGTSLAYIQLAGYHLKDLASPDEMENGPRFQELTTLITTEDYHPGMEIAKTIVRAVCQAAVEVGPPGPCEDMTIGETTIKGCIPVTQKKYDEALCAALKEEWGEFDLEEILKNY